MNLKTRFMHDYFMHPWMFNYMPGEVENFKTNSRHFQEYK
jgi:hypothetical protein